MVNGPEDAEYDKEQQKAANAVDDVVEFHGAGSCNPLTDFNGKGYDHNNREHVKKCYDHGVTLVRQPLKERVADKNQTYADDSNYDKMQFFVGKALLGLIVPG